MRAQSGVESQLRFALGAARIATWDLNLSTGEFEHAGLADLIGFPLENVDFRDQVHPDDLPILREAVNRVREGEPSLHADVRVRIPQGPPLWLQLRAQAREEAGSGDRHLTGVMVDVTDLHRAHEELRHALESRDEFLSVASHELNTPLTALQLNLQNLQRKLSRPSDERIEVSAISAAIAPMVRQLGRLSRLLSNLLDISRIQSRRVHLDLEAFDLCDTVKELLERFAALAARHGVTLELTGCQSLVGYWDRLRIEQIVSNLIVNALKYGRSQPVQVKLERRGDWACVSIKDQGIGIAPDALSKIFDRFQRATPVHSSESFGLGLYISQQMAEAHGGRIEVESELSRGSTFTLMLPLYRLSGPREDLSE